MSQHYGVHVIPIEHKNAINVVVALWFGDDPASAEELGQPLNASGSSGDPITHVMGGWPYIDNEAGLAQMQNLANNLPAATWPVQGIEGSVTEAEAVAAATALYLMVGTAETYTSPLAAQTLASALGALGLKRVTD
jgi:hypothetical protein